MNLSDILLILYPDADRRNDIVVQDDGSGLYIKHWDEDLYGPQPTEQSLLDQIPDLQLAYLQQQVEASIRELVEAKPLERGYDNLMTLTSYTTSSNAQWKAEAEAFIAWRDSIFEYSYQVLADVQAELISLPSFDDFMAKVPTLTWP